MKITHIKPIEIFEDEKGSVLSMAISPDGKYIFTGNYINKICQWSTETGKLIRKLEGHTAWIYTLLVTQDNMYLFSSSRDRTVKKWSIQTGELIQDDVFECVETQQPPIIFLHQHNEVIFSCDYTGMIKKLNISTTPGIITSFALENYIWTSTAEVSVDSKYMLLANMCEIRKIDLDTNENSRVFKCIKNFVHKMVLTPKYLFLASSNKKIDQYSLETEELIHSYEGHDEPVINIVLSPDKKSMFSASWDSTIRKWSLETKECLCIYGGKNSPKLDMLISPDNKFLYHVFNNKVYKYLCATPQEQRLAFLLGIEEREIDETGTYIN